MITTRFSKEEVWIFYELFMSKTLTVLRQQTRTYLDEATTADWTDVEVDREINVAYMKVYTAVVGVFEDYYSTKATASTVADQQEYSLPTDFYKARRVEINYTTSIADSVARRAIPVSLDAVLRDLGDSSSGVTVLRTPCYYIRGSLIGFLPVPTETGSAAITLWYVKQISELSSASDTIDIPFPDRYYDAIALQAAATLLRKGQQEEVVAARYLQEAKDLRDQMMAELEDRTADHTKQVEDLIGDDIDFTSFSMI